MIFTDDKRLEDIGIIVLDEVHYLGDSERGTTWEEIIIHAPKKIKFLSLSATVENKNEFLDWIVSLRGPTELVESTTRPVPLDVELVATERNNEKIYTIKSSKNNKNKSKAVKHERNFWLKNHATLYPYLVSVLRVEAIVKFAK